MKKVFLLLFILTGLAGFSQKKTDKKDLNIVAKSPEIAVLSAIKKDTISTDSLEVLERKIAVIDYTIASDIDKKWLASWKGTFSMDTTDLLVDVDSLTTVVIDELPTDLLKKRLKELDAKTPFNVGYNQSLEKVIKYYLKNRKKTLANLMGRAEYYFPLFEEHLDKYNIPLEIKYLAIVESALKPTVKSRVGAAGLWQFMYGTGKMYDLDVSSYVDERYDPIKSTEAACKFLSHLYKTFGDWDLALAAYNSGPGNVTKAIRRSGGQTNYWNLRPYLPRETADYVPAFYATYYIFEYSKEHNLYATNALPDSFQTDTVSLKRQLTFNQINRIMKTDDQLMTFLNPQYKLKIIPYDAKENNTLRLPKFMLGTFVSNEELIYAYAEADDAKREKPLPANTVASSDPMQSKTMRYKVRRGDNLGKIANKYGVTVANLKKWNKLKGSTVHVGQSLTIHKKGSSLSNTEPVTKNTVASNSESNNGKDFSTYTVKSGDTLWLISQKFPNVTVSQIKQWNNFKSDKLTPGTKLKIY
jgi:membrane-bound lytic murein transglycosylase D